MPPALALNSVIGGVGIGHQEPVEFLAKKTFGRLGGAVRVDAKGKKGPINSKSDTPKASFNCGVVNRNTREEHAVLSGEGETGGAHILAFSVLARRWEWWVCRGKGIIGSVVISFHTVHKKTVDRAGKLFTTEGRRARGGS